MHFTAILQLPSNQMRDYTPVCSSSKTDTWLRAHWSECSEAHVQLTSAPVASMRLFEAFPYRNRPALKHFVQRRRVGKSPDGRIQAGLTRPHPFRRSATGSRRRRENSHVNARLISRTGQATCDRISMMSGAIDKTEQTGFPSEAP